MPNDAFAGTVEASWKTPCHAWKSDMKKKGEKLGQIRSRHKNNTPVKSQSFMCLGHHICRDSVDGRK